MSVCTYCGENAGWLQKSHPACIKRTADTANSIKLKVFNGILEGKPYDSLLADVQQAVTDNKVLFQHVQRTLLQGVNDAITQAVLQAPCSEEELSRLFDIYTKFGMESYQDELLRNRWFSAVQMVLSHALWRVLNNLPPYFDGKIELNIPSTESPIYACSNVIYSEERTQSTHITTFQGMSVRLGKGVYYHFGGSQGHNVYTSGLQQLDTGKALITTRAFYFGGQKKTLRIPLDCVLRYQPYVDAIGICEGSGAPKIFTPNTAGGMELGWFYFNMLSALTTHLSEAEPVKAIKGIAKSGPPTAPSATSGRAPAPSLELPALREAIVDATTAFNALGPLLRTFNDLVIAHQGNWTQDQATALVTAMQEFVIATHRLEVGATAIPPNVRENVRHALEGAAKGTEVLAAAFKEGRVGNQAIVEFSESATALIELFGEFVETCSMVG